MQLTVNGIDTFVATGGREFDTSLPAIVLLHGAGFDHTDLGAAQPLVRASRLWRAGAGSAGPWPLGRRAARRPSPRWPTGPRRCSMRPAPRRHSWSAIPWDR